MGFDDTGTGKAFTKRIHNALRGYRRDEALEKDACDLRDLQVVQTAYQRHSGRGWAGAIRSVLDDGLASLASQDAHAADLLGRRFLHDQSVTELTFAFNYGERTLFARQRQALTALAGLIWQQEEAARAAHHRHEAHTRLLDALPPPTFTQLFGVDSLLAQLKSFLTAPDRRWLIALDGMGGSGKTALARAVAEDLACEGRFQRLAWITAQQQTFRWGRLDEPDRPVLTYTAFLDQLAQALHLPACLHLTEHEQEQRLRHALATIPTLLVVDNLETAADAHALTEGLDQLARPTKVLITTRHRLSAYDQVASLTVRELPPADALAFLRHHSQERNVPALLDAPEADLLRIAIVTGGNPLAMKLVVGQLRAAPLAQVLDDLAAARPEDHDFYHFLFRYSWERLSDPARYLLLHMPLLDARGVSWQDLAAVSGVTLDGRFRCALEELVDVSLLNAGWTQGRLLYSIHRLTEYYLISDLIGGEGQTPGAAP